MNKIPSPDDDHHKLKIEIVNNAAFPQIARIFEPFNEHLAHILKQLSNAITAAVTGAPNSEHWEKEIERIAEPFGGIDNLPEDMLGLSVGSMSKLMRPYRTRGRRRGSGRFANKEQFVASCFPIVKQMACRNEPLTRERFCERFTEIDPRYGLPTNRGRSELDPAVLSRWLRDYGGWTWESFVDEALNR